MQHNLKLYNQKNPHKISRNRGKVLVKIILFRYNYPIKGGGFVGSNYEKDVYKQLQETILIVEKLTAKIAAQEINHKRELAVINRKMNSLTSEITSLKAENQKLKDIINKDSGNSSKPPSSDGFKKIHNSREKSDRKSGGQKGHKGNVPMLYKNPTQIIEHKQEKCKCGGQIAYASPYQAKQLVDIEIKTSIIEHRAYNGVCECCHAKITSRLPINDIITYGENIKSVSAMLSSEGLMSLNRIQSMISEFTNGMISLSEGTIVKWNKDLSMKLRPVIKSIKEKLLVQPVLHKDETGIKINGKMNWLHVLSDTTRTLYFSSPKRGNDADKNIGILPIYSGVLVHDHLKGLYSFGCDHAECNAHILRYLKSAAENKKRNWAIEMIEFLVEAHRLIKVRKASGESRLEDALIAERFSRYDAILEHAQAEFTQNEKKDYNGEDMKLLRRLRQFKTEHLRFITDFSVPFDNNQAERDLRMIKTKSKVSGCFRGAQGGEVFAVIKSYTSTLRKNKQNIFAGILLAFLGMPVFAGVE